MTIASGAGEGVAVDSLASSFTYANLASDCLRFRSQVKIGGRAAIRSNDAGVVSAVLEALDGWAAEVHLLPSDFDPASLGDAVVELTVDLPADITPDLVNFPSVETEWIIYTSGTTGEPKPIRHTTATLSRTVVRSERSERLVWGLVYDPNRMAGLQVILQALAGGSKLVAPPLDLPLVERLDHFARSGVTALSATPTLWRMILQTPARGGFQLQQITLGGEIADQHVLDALAVRFPDARIVHVFASTETGAAFSVRDGRAGFPVSYLTEPPKGIPLSIRDDILHVLSPGVSVAGPDGYASTGDIVEIVDDRVLFRGRASGVVNVGGANVWPEQVEAILRSHPAVQDAVVTAKANALSGNLLVASVVPEEGVDRTGLGKQLRSFVREQAPGTHVPAMVKLVDSLDVSTTGKAVR